MKNYYTFFNLRKSLLSLLLLFLISFTSRGQLYNSLVMSIPATGTTAAHCTAFENWRLTLTRTDYIRVNIRLNGVILFTCTNPTLVRSMASTLRTSTTAPATTTWVDGANQWYIGSCGGIEFGVQLGVPQVCFCLTAPTTATIRPCILGGVWGGIGVNTCGSGAQDVTLEFGSPSGINDAGVIGFDAPSTPLIPGLRPVVARVNNFGINRVNSVTVNWSVNGVLQPPVTSTSILDTNAGILPTNAPVTLGNFTFASNVSYSIRAWTSLPNSLPDTTPNNDTFATIFRTPLNGVYTVGSSGDFNTLTDAATVLSSAGITAPVTLSLINPSYTRSSGEIFPITFRNVIGTSATNTISIVPALSNNPLISDSSSGALIVFDNTKWVRIDGRQSASDTLRGITIENTNNFATSTGNVISFINESSDNTIRNCNIRSAVNNTAANGSIFIGGSNVPGIPQGNDRILIRHNTFAGTRGFVFATGISSIGANTFSQNDNIRIDSNYFYNFRSNGIFASGSGNGSNWLIQSNHFYDTLITTGTNTITCINFNPSTNSNSNGDTIRANFIGGNAPYAPQGPNQRWLYNATGTFQGIVASGGSGTGHAILNNRFRSFKANSPSSFGQIVGIFATNPGVARIEGNTIGDMVDTNSIWTNTNSAFIGMNCFTTNDAIVTNNLISNINVAGSFTGTAARGIVFGTGSNNVGLVSNNWIRAMHTRSANVGGTLTVAAWNGIVIQSSSPNNTITNNTIGGNDPSDSCALYAGPVSGGELGSVTPGGGRMVGIAANQGTNTITNNTIKQLYSQSNGANTINTSANIIGIATSSFNNGQVIQNNTLDSFILRIPAVGNMIAGIVTSSGAAAIRGNTISDLYSNSTSTGTQGGAAITGINSSAAQFQTIENNTIQTFDNGSSTSNQMNGIVITAGAGNIIRGNTIRNLRSNTTSATGIVGIHNPNTSLNSSIIGNTIHSLVSYDGTSATPGIFGILNSGSTTFIGNNAVVTRNIVHSFGWSGSGTGVVIATGIQATSGNVLYANNMVRLGRDSAGTLMTRNATIRGMQLSSTGTLQNRFYHNTIYIESAPASGTANTVGLDLAGNATAPGFTDIRNNIISNNTNNEGSATGNHYVIRHNSTSMANYTINSNIYDQRTSATNFIGRFNAVDYALLTNWQTTVSQDGATGVFSPNFVNAIGDANVVNLRLSSPNPAERGGDTALAFVVSDDVDGLLRDTLTRTDIGAKGALSTLSSDVNGPRIVYAPLVNTTSNADRTFTALIADGFGLPNDPAKLPRVYYKKFTSGPWQNAIGTLASGDRFNGTWSFVMSSSALGGLVSADTVFYYVIAQDSLANNTNSNPMGLAATGVNSVTTHPINPNAYRILAPLPTTILVGSGQTYTSLTATGGAFEAINAGIISANTVIQITSDIVEPGTVALDKWQEQGTGGYTVTIRPQTAAPVILSSLVANANGLLRFNNVDGIRILGWSPSGTIADTGLIIRASSTTTPAIGFINGGSNDTIQGVILESRVSSASQGVVFIGATNFPSTRGVSNVLIQRCFIRQDITTPATTPTNGIFVIGTSPRMNSNIRIDGNHIYNILGTGGNGVNVSGAGAGNGNNFTITNNHFYFNALPSISATAYQAITFGPGTNSDNNIISNNWIGGSAAFASGAPMTTNNQIVPISVTSGTITGTQVNNNVITNITVTGTAGMTGIFVLGTNAVYTVNGNRLGNWNDSIGSINFTASSNSRFQGIDATGTGNVTITNDTVVNINNAGVGGTAGIHGIRTSNGFSNVTIVSNNVVRNLILTATTNTNTQTNAALLGIMVQSGSTNQTVSNNRVQSLVITSSASHQMMGIFVTSGVTTISNNTVFGMQSRTTNANNFVTSFAPSSGIIGIANNSFTTGAHTTINNIVDSLWYTPLSSASAVQILGIAHTANTSIHQSMILNNTVRNINSFSSSVALGGSAAIVGIVQNNPTLNIQMVGNRVHTLNHLNTTTASSVVGIFNNASGTINANNSLVSRNFIHSISSRALLPARPVFTGIFNSAGFTTYANNMIRLGIDSAGMVDTAARVKRGIFQNNNVQNNYYHNSILIAGTPGGASLVANSAAIEIAQNIPNITGFNIKVNIRNNILVNTISNIPNDTSRHYALRFVDTLNILSDYNLFHVTGSTGHIAGTNFANYTQLNGSTTSWKALTGQDMQSGFGDPIFDANAYGTADVATLAVQSTTPIESSGDPSLAAVVTDDYFGNIRSSNTPTDIGAHAGNFNQSPDLFPPLITFTPLIASGTLSGTRPFNGVSITDNNGIPTSGASRPRVYYSKDGTTWFSSASTTITGTPTNAVANFGIDYSLLGTLSVTDTIRYYVLAQDNVSNTISNAPFAVASNVITVSNHPVNPNRYGFLPVLAANTIIPVGVGQTYTSLTGSGGLFEFINSRTLGGNVVAEVTSDLTNETGAFILNQFGEDGPGAGTFTLTIRPNASTTTARLISGNVTNALITLNGASRVKITGVPLGGSASARLLRFRNDNFTASTILARNGAQGVLLNNLVVEGGNSSTTGGVITFAVTSGTVPCTNDTVNGCFVTHNSTGILPAGVPAFAVFNDGATGVLNTNFVVTNNEISNYLNSGAVIGNNFGNGFTISNNSFYNNIPTIPSSTNFWSINVVPGANSSGNTVTNNFIGGSAANCGGTPWSSTSLTTQFIGIRISTGTGANTLIQNNTVRNIAFTASGTAVFSGISVLGGNTIITGNTIGSTTANNSIVFANATTHNGIDYNGSNNGTITNNTIAGITVGTTGQTCSFNGISAFNGAVGTIDNNTVGSTLPNSIRNIGVGTTNGINISFIPINLIPAFSVSNNTVQNIHMAGPQATNIIRGIIVGTSALPTIAGNTVTNLTTNSTAISSTFTTQALAGITISASSSVIPVVRNNTISALRALNTSAAATPNVSGIVVSSGQDVVINANRIFDLTNASTALSQLPTPSVSAINIVGGSVRGFLTNNQITLGSGQGANTQFIGIWLNLSSTAYVLNAFNNSILITGTVSSGNQNSYAFLRGNNTTTELNTFMNLRNNIFANNRTGGTGLHFAIANQTPSPSNTTWVPASSQYNLLVSANVNTMGQWGSTGINYATWTGNLGSTSDGLSYYMQAGTGAGQLNLSNLFTNTSNGNLGIQTANVESWYVFGKGAAGTVINNLNSDFAGNSRGTVFGFGTTIGATQISTPPSMLPPAAVASSTPAASTSVNYNFAGRRVATINWGTSAPTAATLLNFTGITPANQPSGNNANQYVRVDVSGGTTPYNYGVDLTFDPALLGAVSSTTNLKVSKETTGSTATSPIWATQPISTVNTALSTVSATGLTSSLANLFFTSTENNAPPVISGFTPSSRQVGGAVTINGRNFTGTTALSFFNGVAQPTFTVVNDTTITTTVPAGATTGVVGATNANGTASSTAVLTVIQAPTIVSFNPGINTRGGTVVITGTNFNTATLVQFNGVTAAFTINSATQITTTVPATGTTGNITVINPAGTATSSTPFTVILAPTVTSFTPTSGPVATVVSINGTNFQSITNVAFNGVAASYTVNSTTNITATVPAGASTGTVSVTNGSGTGTSGTNFTVTTPPTITAFSPSSGGVGTIVVLAGTNFTGTTAVTFNGIAATAFTVNSPTQITVTVPTGATTGLINVTTPSGSVPSAGNFNVIGNLVVTTTTGITGTYNNITITSTGNAILTGPLTALGNVLVQTGGRLNFGTEVLSGNGTFINQSGTRLITASANGLTATGGVTGSIQVAGTRTYSNNAYYLFNGSSAQQMGDGITAADTLEIGNTAGVSLSSNITLNNRLILGNGNLVLGNFSLTIAPTATIGAASATSYIVTNNSPITGGFLRMTVANTATNVTYPIGTITSYTPLLLQQTTGATSDVFSARVFNGVNAGGVSGTPFTTNAVDRTWLITEGTIGGSNVTATLTWSTADHLTSFDNTACNVAYYIPAGWQPSANAAAFGASPYTRSRAGLTIGLNNTPFTVADASGVVPVTLVNFAAAAANEDVYLKWTTASETNNQGFILERSEDGVNFKDLTNITGAGNSIKVNNYVYTDEQAFSNSNVLYYRLKDVDFNGNETIISDVISVSKTGTDLGQVNTFPNPVADKLTMVFASKNNGPATIEISDIAGKQKLALTKTITEGINTLELTDMHELPSGIYFVKLTVSGESRTVKVVKN